MSANKNGNAALKGMFSNCVKLKLDQGRALTEADASSFEKYFDKNPDGLTISSNNRNTVVVTEEWTPGAYSKLRQYAELMSGANPGEIKLVSAAQESGIKTFRLTKALGGEGVFK